ncbi:MULTISPECIES: Imm1 family immunity protein [Actinosynnema]|uniref:Imm1 family immunity protein n=1 Tax=Actinosynnema TaxID=40566 RepID=UPI0020A37574|nr:Imm1 family immunity protein [Actinosynnema pretiosum]MCP2093543.1 Immunity protein Imm1 [Actinosynnema pretiosum]
MPKVEFCGSIEGDHYRSGEWVVESAEEITDALDRVFAPRWPHWTHCQLHLLGSTDGFEIFVYPEKGYTSLQWAGTHSSKNPNPFPDAPLVAEEYDNDPLMHWMRDSYITREDARAAILEYVETGERPTCVEWQPDGREAYELPEPIEGHPDLWDDVTISIITDSTPEADAEAIDRDQAEASPWVPIRPHRPPEEVSPELAAWAWPGQLLPLRDPWSSPPPWTAD